MRYLIGLAILELVALLFLAGATRRKEPRP